MKNTRKKSTGTKRHMILLPVFLVALVALILGTTASVSWGWGWGGFDEFDDAECGFEVNLTDFDTGFRACVDAEAWKWLQIYRKGENYRDKELLFWTSTAGKLRGLGLTELCFESDEPVEEFEDILALFPAGECKFIAKKTEGGYLKSTADLSHDFACGVQEITLTSNGIVINPETDCVPTDQDLIVSWDPVETKLTEVTGEDEFECEEDLSEAEQDEISYEVVVEAENQELFFTADAETTEVTVPASFLEGIEMEEELPKIEILVVFGANKSIQESEFETCSE